MKLLKKGNFVTVGKDSGVVVFLEFENDTPEGHLGIWFGETNKEGKPIYRTVPSEYCQINIDIESYH